MIYSFISLILDHLSAVFLLEGGDDWEEGCGASDSGLISLYISTATVGSVFSLDLCQLIPFALLFVLIAWSWVAAGRGRDELTGLADQSITTALYMGSFLRRHTPLP